MGGYGSYLLSTYGTVRLPGLHYTDATNGIFMEFDLSSVTGDVQVNFINQGLTTTFGPFSASGHYTVRAVDDLGAQNAYFQFVGEDRYALDNIVIYKAPSTMKPYNVTATDITTNRVVISWTDDNINSHTLELYYRIKGNSAWISPISVTGTSHTLTGLTPYTDYEVMVKTIVGNEFSNSEIAAQLQGGTHARRDGKRQRGRGGQPE